MKRIFVDTNILLDVLLDRAPFSEPAQRLWSHAERRVIRAAISGVSIHNVFFIVRKLSSVEKGYKAIDTLASIFDLVDLSGPMIRKALQIRFPDFEDGLQYVSALKYRAQAIISRDPDGFLESRVPVMDCDEYLARKGLSLQPGT